MRNNQTFQSIKQSQIYSFKPGHYYIRLSGAQGGKGSSNGNLATEGGRGSILTFFMEVRREIDAYVYVGSKGEDASTSYPAAFVAAGGWNGGGIGGIDYRDDDSAGAGGGGTDIRLINSQDEEGWNSRIAVAAGGSGAADGIHGAPGGSFFPYRMIGTRTKFDFEEVKQYPPKNSKIFYGADGIKSVTCPSPGGGGGYYGGTAVDPDNQIPSGTGATSYVAGCYGEDNMTLELERIGIIIHTWDVIPGFPMLGNEGNGEAYIEKLSICGYISEKRKNNLIIFLNFLIVWYILRYKIFLACLVKISDQKKEN